jgi:hypothetical protein
MDAANDRLGDFLSAEDVFGTSQGAIVCVLLGATCAMNFICDAFDWLGKHRLRQSIADRNSILGIINSDEAVYLLLSVGLSKLYPPTTVAYLTNGFIVSGSCTKALFSPCLRTPAVWHQYSAKKFIPIARETGIQVIRNLK